MRLPLLAALIAAAATLPAHAQVNCPEEQGLHSINSERETSITFVNQTPVDLQLLWINFDGARERYAIIQRGQSHTQPTYVTHPWAAYTLDGDCLGVYFPEARPREIWIDGSD